MADRRFADIQGILKGSEVNRLEVLDSSGRAYVNCGVHGVEFLLQDDGKTLKIVVKEQIKVE